MPNLVVTICVMSSTFRYHSIKVFRKNIEFSHALMQMHLYSNDQRFSSRCRLFCCRFYCWIYSARRWLCYQSTAIKIQLLANSQECGIQRSLSAIAVAFSCLTIYLTNVRRAVKNLNEISEVVRPDTVRRIQDAITRFKFCEWKIVVLSLLYSTSKYNAMEIFLLR